MTTPYHSQYWAHALSLRGPSDTVEALSRSIASARVDLNPHQVDAALFAVRSPLSRGVILADEVGLGKTIEAGLVIAQKWAERKRRILLVLPATLRKQWQQELAEKFGLESVILESGTYREAIVAGSNNPFDREGTVLICSYQFAAARAADVRSVRWDLAVVDEAHRLRNVYKPGAKTAIAVRDALKDTQKVLLTATPLQNSLLELYGLVSVIDPHVFGDLESFREQFVRATDDATRNARLKARLAPLCKRTLRKQVLEYIRFTRRVPITQTFEPDQDEQALYDAVSEYLRRDVLNALPPGQRQLITLVLRKLLASSSFAIGKTLKRLVSRLEDMARRAAQPTADAPLLDEEDYEAVRELRDEWTDGPPAERSPSVDDLDPEALVEELEELRRYAALADRISVNAKGEALLDALQTAFGKAESLGAARKAVVFTESRRTQQYLLELLSAHGYAGQIVLINGSNTDPASRAIHAAWLERHRGSDLVSASRTADTKAALVEEFRDRATILLATESAAEGVNLQFCSLIVNYDLPWNPQRVEQRIGRCHRYGQKHDVVVVNFLNARNEADQRVFELLNEKFRLFDGVFGASDEVLGAVESGVDLERRIVQVYQECRTPAEIQAAFDLLRAELDAQIGARLDDTRRTLLEHFDEDVQQRLRVHRDRSLEALHERERWLYSLTRHELAGAARFDPERASFEYAGALGPAGRYFLDWRDAESEDGVFYRLEHELAQALIGEARSRLLPVRAVEFQLAGRYVGALDSLRGRSGWLEVSKLTAEALDREEFLVFAARTDAGESLDDEQCRKLLGLDAHVLPGEPTGTPGLDPARATAVRACLRTVEERNARHFDEETGKLDAWAEDLKHGLEREIKDIDREIRDTRKAAASAVSLADKLEAQKMIRDLEARRNKKRRELYAAQDDIDEQRNTLIAGVERQLTVQHEVEPLFTLRWTLG